MTGDWVVLLLCALGTLTISFFCSLWEAALYAVSQSRVEVLKKAGSRMGRKLAKLRRNIDEPIAAILVLNTISHTGGAAAVGAKAADIAVHSGYSLSKGAMVGLAGVVFTLLILFLSEIIPKTLGVVHASTVAPFSAYPIQWTIWGLYPIVKICQLLTNSISPEANQGEVTEEELLTMAQTSAKTGTLLQEEARWVKNVLSLDEMQAADVMTPRTVMFIKDSTELIENVREEAPGWVYSRIPIAPNENPDEIEGIVMRRDVLEELAEGDTEKPLSTLTREVQFVPEDEALNSILQKSVTSREHLFVVKDRYGGVSGIVTLEDVFEEIIGQEIMDETDRHADLQNLARLLYKSEKRSREEPRRRREQQQQRERAAGSEEGAEQDPRDEFAEEDRSSPEEEDGARESPGSVAGSVSDSSGVVEETDPGSVDGSVS